MRSSHDHSQEHLIDLLLKSDFFTGLSMKITITRAAFDTALHIEGKSFWLSQQLKVVQLALTSYVLDRDNPALEPAARNNLNFAIYTWKQQKPADFDAQGMNARYDGTP